MGKRRIRPWLGLAVLVVVLALVPVAATLLSGCAHSPTALAAGPAPQLASDCDPPGLAPTLTEWHFWAVFGLVLLGGYVLQSGDRDAP